MKCSSTISPKFLEAVRRPHFENEKGPARIFWAEQEQLTVMEKLKKAGDFAHLVLLEQKARFIIDSNTCE